MSEDKLELLQDSVVKSREIYSVALAKIQEDPSYHELLELKSKSFANTQLDSVTHDPGHTAPESRSDSN